ncbi:hypothetical protein JCM10908_006701 [Rhodotorula pacifica]|uniref:uncharacterized protein n=1 Tax=Rhodotorula pacifica TaxID=1495444 RepID=UPI00317609FB
MSSARTLLQIDPNSHRIDSSSGSNSDADSMPATPSKDKFREWTFPRTKAGSGTSGAPGTGGGPASRSIQGTSTSTGTRPGYGSVSRGSAGIRTGGGGSIAARRPSVAARQSSRAAGELAQAVSSAPLSSTGASPGVLKEVAHGRSSSVAPHNSSPKRQRPPGSTDFRHRSNASLLASPIMTNKSAATDARSSTSSSFIKVNMPTSEAAVAAPNRLARLVLSITRRRSLGEVIYLVLFSASIVVWATALCGYGHTASASGQPIEVAAAVPVAVPDSIRPAPEVIDVRIPDSLLPPQGRSDPNDEYLADVHQREGDSSHDEGDDHFQASPLDPALEDENVPLTHHNEAHDSLWSDHDLEDLDAAAQARLGHGVDETVDVEDLDPAHSSTTLSTPLDILEDEFVDLSSEVDASEDDLGPELLDPTHGDATVMDAAEDTDALPRDLAEAADPEAAEDEEENPMEDDSIPIEEEESESAGDIGSLHVIDADDGPGAPTALDELLDSAAEEQQETLVGGTKNVPADTLFRAPGTKNRKAAQKRSAKAQAQAQAQAQAKPVATLAERDARGMKIIIKRD